MLLLVHRIVHDIIHEVFAALHRADGDDGFGFRRDFGAGAGLLRIAEKARIDIETAADDLALDGPVMHAPAAIDFNFAAGLPFKMGQAGRADQCRGRRQRSLVAVAHIFPAPRTLDSGGVLRSRIAAKNFFRAGDAIVRRRWIHRVSL